MKISAIDVGSNSVRLMVMADGKTLYKQLDTTRLAEGLAQSGVLKPEAIERTARAVQIFAAAAELNGAGTPYVFATAAVRSSKNGADFVARVKALTGIDVDVLSGEEEAACGILGALRGRDGGIIDLGGASTEITLQQGGKTLYSKSVNIGTVRLFDMAGQDRSALQAAIDNSLNGYGSLSLDGKDIYGIGGTATSLAALYHELEKYDPKVVEGTVLTREWLCAEAEKLLSLTVEERRALRGMEPRRADVIAGGCLLMYSILNRFNADRITVSESDNLEGYVLLKGLVK
ncbi:MAG TPA: Ppx/GppA family phosphatase [Candidatus Coproplasma stercoripullorum]|uniref:Ppx/GppA family phosphatase n=1 Tax=Candidatus Coproplasma stercoripullorum TaxID=2840751 RepID=A0A9D1DB02_9FIRM|nr:Ppx/GppA family phosphatase [Candidatus Coproplasma stercoripullorum]